MEAKIKFDPDKHHRRSIWLKDYDYSRIGAYFVTICTQNRSCLFGEFVEDELVANAAGKMVEAEWLALPQRFAHIELDEYVVMPNHFHGIIMITKNKQNAGASGGHAQNTDDHDSVRAPFMGAPNIGAPNMGARNVEGTDNAEPESRAGTRPAPTITQNGTTRTPTLDEIIEAFKSMTTNAYIRGVKQQRWPPFPGKLWQRNYFERVIRNEDELNRIREYIFYNPAKWFEDHDNPMKRDNRK